MNLTTPTIHINGTSARTLIDGYLAAYEALRVAWDKVAATAPNGRDYYVQPAGSFANARAEHLSRLDRIEALRKEIEALCLAVNGDR